MNIAYYEMSSNGRTIINIYSKNSTWLVIELVDFTFDNTLGSASLKDYHKRAKRESNYFNWKYVVP